MTNCFCWPSIHLKPSVLKLPCDDLAMRLDHIDVHMQGSAISYAQRLEPQ